MEPTVKNGFKLGLGFALANLVILTVPWALLLVLVGGAAMVGVR